MDRDSTGLEVTRRHLLRLVGGLAVLVGYRARLCPTADGSNNGKEKRNEN